jgi:arylsulfatase A-like enzyme
MINSIGRRTPEVSLSALVGAILLLGGPVLTGQTTKTATAGDGLDRTVLPIAEPKRGVIKELDARNAKAPARFEVKAPQGAPNVVIVLVDDMGFGVTSTFGGPVRMPTLDRMASEGLRYNNFHTTALCSPTRMALKTGRNHHSANTGAVMEVATAFPGNTGMIPHSIAPVAEMLRLNGYSTGAFGKWHETPAWETSPSGPFDRWPVHQGFDKFYGFLGGETNQYAPLVFDGVTKVEVPKDPNYHFTTDMTTHAIEWMRNQQALTPDKPFFLYYAPGATHAPHHVPKEWADKYKGKFDQGWDKMREETLARQIKLGVVPAGTKLAGKPEAIKDWDKLTPDEKGLFTRQAEVYAGFAEHTDNEIGRLVKAMEDMGVMDNTLFLYIAGDNGASAEGGMVGMYNEMTYFNGVQETVADQLKSLDKWGGPQTFPHMAAGWAVAFDAPFMWTKQVASNYGGTRNGMVIRWPKGIKAKGEQRSQFHHVIDVAPTILKAARLPEPKIVNGTPQAPIEGVSMAYTFDDAKAKSRHNTQYFEIGGNRAIYHDGWLAGTVHRAPWELKPRRPLQDDVWELYNVEEDFSLANDQAAKNPQKLKEMQDLFLIEAAKYSVLPIDDRSVERMNPSIAGRPDLMGSRKTLTLYEGMQGMMENVFINVKNRSLTITADIETKGVSNGVLLCQGGRFGGWSLYVKDGKPVYDYNYLGLQHFIIRADKPLPAGASTIKLEFAYDGGKPGAGGTATLYVNGQKAAEGRIEKTEPNTFSADETADIGLDEGTPVSAEYGEHNNKFTGKIKQIVVAVK